MATLLGALTVAGGLFLFLWYRTLVSLPLSQQPLFIHPMQFKWGIPLLGLLLFVAGLFLISATRPWFAVGAVFISALLTLLVLRFDRYSANMRLIYDRYRTIRRANPNMEDLEVLFHTARWRYPAWTHDRIVELVAGKDIQGLILVMLISENKINPISDWELYRSLKDKVARVTQTGR